MADGPERCEEWTAAHAEVRYFVAESDQRVVGQLMLTREWSDWRNGWMIWLQSVYVDAAFRRGGVFRSLFEYSIETLRQETTVDGIRLYVETCNEAAKSAIAALAFAIPEQRTWRSTSESISHHKQPTCRTRSQNRGRKMLKSWRRIGFENKVRGTKPLDGNN